MWVGLSTGSCEIERDLSPLVPFDLQCSKPGQIGLVGLLYPPNQHGGYDSAGEGGHFAPYT